VVISQGEIWWADFPSSTGSGSGFRRPVVVMQCDALNRSRITTAVCVPLTSNLKWGLDTWKSPLISAPYRPAKGFRGQRV
jgi:mRNA-degrading endonuclease toxin of MazEF toxin-antitoxin module